MRTAVLFVGVGLGLLAPAYTLVQGKRVDIFAPSEEQGRRISGQAEATATRFEKVFGALPESRGAVVVLALDLDALMGGDLEGEKAATRSLEIDGSGIPDDLNWRKNGAQWVLPWPDLPLAKIVRRLGGAAAADIDPAALDAFSHELAHLFFIHLVNDRASPAVREAFNGYGSYLADWLDETAAVLHEPEAMKKMRRERWRAEVEQGRYISLGDFFTMAHPSGGHGKGLGGAPGMGGAAEGGAPQSVSLFYLQCLSFGEFLLEQYGTDFLRHVVEKFAGNEGMKDALPWLEENREKLRRVPEKAPATVKDLEETWLAWARRRAAPPASRR